MLFAVTGLHGCPVEAGDGHIGAVKDFLFDDQSWKVRSHWDHALAARVATAR